MIDFLRNRGEPNLGRMRKVLRPWIGRPETVVMPDTRIATAPVPPRDRAGVVADVSAMPKAPDHPYLVAQRGIPQSVLSHPRFAGKVLKDRRRNAVFPHIDKEGVCGYEMKNERFTGFSRGGEKGLWLSGLSRGDNRLVIAETAVDALSFAALHPDTGTGYASTAGAVSDKQIALVTATVRRLAPDSAVVIATDGDRGGDALAARLGNAIRESGRSDIKVQRARPPEGQDWNDVLKSGVSVGRAGR